MISRTHKLIFIHYPRTGGTPLELLLAGRDQIATGLKHIPAKEARQRYQRWWNDYLKVALVRHPADHLASYAVWGPYEKGSVERSVWAWLQADTVGDYTGNSWDRSLIGQRRNLGSDWSPFAEDWHLMRFESLAEDYKCLGERIGVPLELPAKRLMPTRERAGRAYLAILGESNVRAVERVLGEDYRAFGYPLDYD